MFSGIKYRGEYHGYPPPGTYEAKTYLYDIDGDGFKDTLRAVTTVAADGKETTTYDAHLSKNNRGYVGEETLKKEFGGYEYYHDAEIKKKHFIIQADRAFEGKFDGVKEKVEITASVTDAYLFFKAHASIYGCVHFDKNSPHGQSILSKMKKQANGELSYSNYTFFLSGARFESYSMGSNIDPNKIFMYSYGDELGN
jgi:hypothetical protein